jgi:ketosteroid isomerase-like protein
LTRGPRRETLRGVPDSDAVKLEVAGRLMDAIQAGDVAAVDALYADDMVGWRNFDRRELGKRAMLRVIEFLAAQVRDLHYDAIRVETTPRGYVQQHVLHAIAPDGTRIESPACLVVEVQGGRIRRLEEYLDSAAIAPLLGRPG